MKKLCWEQGFQLVTKKVFNTQLLEVFVKVKYQCFEEKIGKYKPFKKTNRQYILFAK